MPKRFFLILASFIILLGSVLRLYHLGNNPVSLYWDEAAILVDAKSIAETGKDMHGSSWLQAMFPSYGDYKLPVYIWLASLSVKLFGATALAVRLPSALIGIATIILAGLLVKTLFSEKILTSRLKLSSDITSLAAMFVVAVAPWSILFSRTGFEGHVGQFFLGIAVLLVLKQNRWFYPYLAAISAALATYSYFSVRFVWPVLVVAAWLLFHRWWSQRQLNLKTELVAGLIRLVLPLGIYALCLVPLFSSPHYAPSNTFRLSTTSVLNMHDWALASNQIREVVGDSVLSRVLYHRHVLMIRELLINVSDHLDLRYLFLSGDSNLRHGTSYHGLFLAPFLVFFLIGLYGSWIRNKRFTLFLGLWWLAALLPASVPESTPHALRSLNALLPVSLLIAVGLHVFISKLSKSWKTWQAKVVAAVTVFLVGFSLAQFWYFYFTVYPTLSASSWQAGYAQLASAIWEKHEGVRTVWVDPFDNRFYLWLLAYGPLSATQIQELSKANYQLDTVGNISIKPFDWEKLKTLDHKLIVAGPEKYITDQLSAHQVEPTWTETISDPTGTQSYQLVGFGE